MKNWRIGVKIGLSFGLLFLAILIIGFSTTGNYSKIKYKIEDLIQSMNTIDNLHTFMSHLADAETGQRGYMITGDTKYLEPYEHAIYHIEDHLAEIKNQITRNPVQLQNYDLLQNLVHGKKDDMEHTINLLKNEGIEKAQQKVSEGSGKEIMDQIRKLFAQMEAEENISAEAKL